jgi:hypothetical protein
MYTNSNTCIQSSHDINELVKSEKVKIEESLKVIVEPNRTSSLLPNGQLHGDTIFTNDSYKNVKHFQTYSFGVLLSETIIFPEPKQKKWTEYINKFISFDFASYYVLIYLESTIGEIVCTKTYNYMKNQLIVKINYEGKTYFECSYLIDSGKKHGTNIYFINKQRTTYYYCIYHRNKIFYREEVFNNKLTSKFYRLNAISVQKIYFNR